MLSNLLPRKLRPALILLLIACAAPLAAQPAPWVILVRHAERAGGMSADVGISPAGRCRAEVLAKMLADTGITRIYTSEVARTQQTAEPLARKLGIAPEAVPAKDIGGLVAQLRAGASRGIALVVGHSNTLPEIVARLGAGTVPPIGDSEYDRMFIVTFTGANQAALLTLRYPGCTPQ